MSLLSGIEKTIAGVWMVAAGLASEALLPPVLGQVIGGILISAGAGMVLSGAGTMIAGNHLNGFATATRNPIKPWDVLIGSGVVGGTLAYMQQWGTQNQMLDLVFILSSAPMQEVTSVLFDKSRVTFNTSVVSPSTAGTGLPTIGGTSYAPAEQKGNTAVFISSIVRSGSGVVTVILTSDIPYLAAGDRIRVVDSGGTGHPLQNAGLVGTVQVSQIISRISGHLTFTYLSGGLPVTLTTGAVTTVWADYGRNVYYEVMLGHQVLGQTFNSMISVGSPGESGGTPWCGNFSEFVSPELPGDAGFSPGSNGAGEPNPWTNYCSLQGKAAVHLRLKFDAKYFASGLPQISFLGRGKNDIYDPRLGDLTGIGTATLDSPGAGGYHFGDVLIPAGGASGALTLTGVDGSGNPTSWMVTQTGSGYALATGAAAPGGHGSGATFNITRLVGIQSGVSTASIASGGGGINWRVGDITQLSGGTGCFIRITSVSSGVVTGFIRLNSGRGYNSGIVGTTGGNAGQQLMISITVTPESSAVYSENTALVIADFLADPIWGYGARYLPPGGAPNSINTTALTAAANICDTATSLNNGGAEPLWAANGKFDLSMRRGDILKNLLTACAGRFSYVDGQYTIFPAVWTGSGAPSFDLMANAAGSVRWKGISIRDLFNGVKGTYISPDNKWQSTDFPPYAQDGLHGYFGPAQYAGDINLEADGGERRWFDVHLPFTISCRQAQQTAKVELLRRRQFDTATFVLNMQGYQFVPLDVFLGTHSYLGWSGKVLEVQAVRFRAEKQTINAE